MTGTAEYGFAKQAIDATVSVDGPGAEDGTLRIKGVWFGFGVPTTVLTIRGTLDGRTVSLQVRPPERSLMGPVSLTAQGVVEVLRPEAECDNLGL